MARVSRSTCVVAALCAAWYALSSASNVVGKVTLTSFPYPMTLAMAQLASTAAYSAPLLAACGVPARSAPARDLLPLAFAKFLTTVCSQISLWKVPVSYAHTVKATTPLWTAGLAWAVLGERQPRAVCVALVVIAAGVALASATELQFALGGLAAALAAAALLALQHIYSKRVLVATGAHPLRLLQRLSLLAGAMFLPLWAWRDGRALWPGAGGGEGAGALTWRAAGLLAADGLLAWLQAVCAFSVLARVSPLTYGVASVAKRACVVLLSLVVLRNPAPPLNVAGMALALLGVALYDRARPRRALGAHARPLLPV